MKTYIVLIINVLLMTATLYGQVNNPKETVKRKTEDRVNGGADRAIDRGLDKVEEGIGNIFKKKKKKKDQEDTENKNAENEQENSENTNQAENTPYDPANEKNRESRPTKSTPKPSASTSKFDFVSGTKVLYADDFSRVDIGDFPADFNTNASGEVVNIDDKPGKWLAMTKNGVFNPENIKELPDNFTLEFEVGLIGDPTNNYTGLGLRFHDDLESMMEYNFKAGSFLYLHPGAGEASIFIDRDDEPKIENSVKMPQWDFGKADFAKVSIWRQKGRLRLYANENKLIDMPRFFSDKKTYRLTLFRNFFDDCTLFMSNIRYAIAGEDTRSKLITEGKLVTNEILFDVNSDRIKPESAKAINDIGAVLKDNPTIRVRIIGHTDSDGDEQSNLSLSQKRAIAVKQKLMLDFGISDNRFETDGKGESLPVESNATPQGKANNRRVEFIKL